MGMVLNALCYLILDFNISLIYKIKASLLAICNYIVLNIQINDMRFNRNNIRLYFT